MRKTYIDDVWKVTATIPKGKVTTYGAIADYLALGSARMVGWALSQLPLFEDNVPAHRVLNRKGELSGRNSFPTPDLMQKRLEADGVVVINDKVVEFEDLFWHPAESEL